MFVHYQYANSVLFNATFSDGRVIDLIYYRSPIAGPSYGATYTIETRIPIERETATLTDFKFQLEVSVQEVVPSSQLLSWQLEYTA